MAFKFRFVDLQINYRSFKCPFVYIATGRVRLIRGYNIENAQYWKIYNKGQFDAIAKTNNFKQRPIQMHK